MRERLERAYEAGDHRTARALAQQLVAESHDAELAARARAILAATTPDPFLTVIGVLGLGLTAWLVYNFVW